ncbi:Acylamino-acid-releasing enzyme [Rhynchospora pubera]|uniref:acylaminoacyl-peptidase n=1 Tax=Rhynchospora pubera TaxID=906938 RepID=A0AAV8DF09_9POAL|nr:Acylamino-acid-releasing enzyme [Rhynchospora pubera]
MASVLSPSHSIISHYSSLRHCCSFPRTFSFLRLFSKPLRASLISSPISTMGSSDTLSEKDMPLGLDASTVEEYSSQSKLLLEFTKMPTVDKAWAFKSDNDNTSKAMFLVSQTNLLANKRRKSILSTHISNSGDQTVEFQWSPFPIEITGVSTVVPSPSGLKLLVVRNGESESPTKLEIWNQCQVEKEINVPQSVHGSIYTDAWFEGISWNKEETLIAYVAEEPPLPKPSFTGSGFSKKGSNEKDSDSWKGQGDWEEEWGETYFKKRRPTLFVVDISSGEIRAVEGISRTLSTGQVVWAPHSSNGTTSYLVFVGWSSENGFQKTPRKLGIKYCYNRPCSLYAIPSPFQNESKNEDISTVMELTRHGLSSAFFPVFSPDGNYLVFLSAKSAVDSGAHGATCSLHKIEWPSDGVPKPELTISDVVPVVMCPNEESFPGLYCSGFLSNPWLSDGSTIVVSSVWRSRDAILSINILSGEVSQVSPDSDYSWDLLSLDGDNIIAVSSCIIDPPKVKYGHCTAKLGQSSRWTWVEVSNPLLTCSDKIKSFLSERNINILKVPVTGPFDGLSSGAKNPYEAIFASCEESASHPTILVLHGGPHSVFTSSYYKSYAFLSSLGFNILMVNYRGSLGFGEEALQSLPGNIGSQDVNDVLAALDYVIEKGLIDANKVVVVGGSHGGFLTTHLIGQAPDRFVAAVARNPVCNLSLMVGTTDIPDWVYFESCGKEGKNYFSESPSVEYLSLFYQKSPISHLSKVKTPVLFLLGAQDLRVPMSNGLQYVRALRERGGEVKVIVFPDDVHGIDRPQSDFEGFLNVGVWFKKHFKK